MRILALACFCWLSLNVFAADVGDLRLIQARAELPRIDLWLELPEGTVLTANQFNISVGSHPVDISSINSFNQTGEGISYIFLVDVSKSLNPQQFTQIKQALAHWLDGMTPKDRAAVISFGSEVKEWVAFTDDRDKLDKIIAQLAAEDKETSLFRGLLDAIALGRQENPALPSRRAIVVLSDGIDDSVNGVSFEEVIKQTDEFRVPIHSIGFAMPPLNDTKRNGLKVLGMLARQSGGHFVQAEAGQLDVAYERQFQQITQAYRLRLDCPNCVADGQSYRLNLTWNDGQHSYSDGLDLRLLPRSQAPAEAVAGLPLDNTWLQIYVISLAALVIGILLLWLYRRRQAISAAKEIPFKAKDIIVETATPSIAAPSQPAQGGFKVTLITVSGAQKGQCHRLQIVSSVFIGRLPSCELCIGEDSEVSAQHAVLRIRDNRLMVRDLHSTNGTLVNGVPIHNEFPLRNGDLLLLGRTELRIALP